MQKLITFGHVFVNSLANPQYYQKLAQVKAWFSWQYFLFLNFLLSFVVLAYVIPAVVTFEVAPMATQVVEVFPAGVVISGDTSGLRINQDLPYSIPFPAFMQEEALEQLPEEAYLQVNNMPYDQAVEFNLVTFTTDELVQNVQDFYDTQSLIVVTETTIYALEDADTGEVRVYGMPSFEEAFSVSQDDLRGWANQIISHPFFAQKWYVPLLGVGSVLLTLPLSIWLRTIAVGIYTLLVWILVSFFMKTKKLTYGKLFQLGLHSLTLPLVVKIVVDYFQWFDFSGFWFMLAYLVWTLFLVSHVADNTQIAHHANAAHVPKPKKTTSKKTKK